ncbi:MAG: hypothetical protein GYB66_12715 [Chloroflexi bacterium]|nr:hypothetical protein [Chloroflexota bacterium]
MKRQLLPILTTVIVMLGLIAAGTEASFAQRRTATPTASPTQTASPSVTITMTPTGTQTPSASETPSLTPTPSPTSNNAELREAQEDLDIGLRFELDASCFEVDQEITGRLEVRNWNDVPRYFYLSGQIAFSINNSPLLPDFPPRKPLFREDFVLIAPNQEIILLILEDLGLYIQGMGPESGIDFDTTATVFGLPTGEYWVTAAYINPYDGLEQQADQSYLVPQAAWQGLAVSREVRFTVVDDLDDCPEMDGDNQS